MKKLAQINSICGHGSTGRITYDLAIAFKSAGFDSRVYYGLRQTDYPDATKFTSDIEVKLHILKTRLLGKHAFYSKRSTKRLVKMLKAFEPNVIMLGQVHGHYLNIPVLFDYFKESGVPVVWALHDCWAMTGHCAHFAHVGCEKWKTGCYKCPQLLTYPKSLIFDRSKESWRDKKKYFTQPENITLVAPSHWIADRAKESFLKHPVVTIYHGVDLNVFRPQDGTKHKAALGIDSSSFVVLGVANKWFSAENKDKALTLIEKSPETTFIIGGYTDSYNITLPKNVRKLDYISDISELALTYSCADVFINMSYEDSFSMVTAESLACGTPVIGYNSTAIPEVIGDAGVVLDTNADGQDFADALDAIKPKLSALSKTARERAVQLFDQTKNYQQYIDLIKEKMQ